MHHVGHGYERVSSRSTRSLQHLNHSRSRPSDRSHAFGRASVPQLGHRISPLKANVISSSVGQVHAPLRCVSKSAKCGKSGSLSVRIAGSRPRAREPLRRASAKSPIGFEGQRTCLIEFSDPLLCVFAQNRERNIATEVSVIYPETTRNEASGGRRPPPEHIVLKLRSEALGLLVGHKEIVHYDRGRLAVHAHIVVCRHTTFPSRYIKRGKERGVAQPQRGRSRANLSGTYRSVGVHAHDSPLRHPCRTSITVNLARGRVACTASRRACQRKTPRPGRAPGRTVFDHLVRSHQDGLWDREAEVGVPLRGENRRVHLRPSRCVVI